MMNKNQFKSPMIEKKKVCKRTGFKQKIPYQKQ